MGVIHEVLHTPTLSREIARAFESAAHDEVFLRLHDGREYMLVAVDDFDVELARTRANARLMDLLDARARQTKLVPLDEVKRRFDVK